MENWKGIQFMTEAIEYKLKLCLRVDIFSTTNLNLYFYRFLPIYFRPWKI